MIPAECVESIDHPQIKVADARSTSAVFANPDRQPYRRIRFDGCVPIPTAQVACDWVLERNLTQKQDGERNQAKMGRIAIELKGSNVGHAARQIESALEFLAAHDKLQVKAAGLIVCRQFPKTTADVQRLKDRFRVKFRAKLHVMQERNCRNLSFTGLLGVG